MQLIPVIDILGNRVVHARRGQRDRYRPIESRLCHGSDPDTVVRALLNLYPFPVVYIADLDAIEAQEGNDDCIRQLTGDFPDIEFWLDRGDVAGPADHPSNVTSVAATETGLTRDRLLELCRRNPATVLSLDFKGNHLVGDTTLLEYAKDWPRRCIVMNLERVGAGHGPDLKRLETLSTLAPDKSFYAAGGVRDETDLDSLASAGAAGALLASALHDGSITTETLQAFSQD